jgi:glycosyltransferase involved in cell wall biosynthesis
MPNASSQEPLKVSVIIPTYNRAGYLREALVSIAQQSMAPWEVIVVDDGSTDDTRQVVEAAPVPIRYYQQDHQGVAAARNLGLDAATGDLIAWLDSDDLWEVDFLATVVGELASDEDLDGVYTGMTMIDAGGQRLQTKTRTEPPEKLYEAMIRGNFLATPSVVVRKMCYDEVGHFDPELRMSEDTDMWLRLTRVFRLAGIPRPLVRIRVHQSNTMSDVEGWCNARLMLLQKHFSPSDSSDPAQSERFRVAQSYAFRAISRKYIENRQPDLGWLYLKRAVMQHPSLLAQLDTFYELALGDQPRGYRGDISRLDIAANGDDMLRRLDALFALVNEQVRSLRGPAYGNAHLALAMLCDQAGHWRAARRHMLSALGTYPVIIFRPGFVRRLLKLLAGRWVINQLQPLIVGSDQQPFGESDV